MTDKKENKWISFVRKMANEKGMKYTEAMRDASVKEAYKKENPEYKPRVKKGKGVDNLEISKDTPLLEVPVSMESSNQVLSEIAETEQSQATEPVKKVRKSRSKKATK
jgi:hypothetical protein